MNVAPTLDAEFKRVAKQEGISMESLVNEVALLAECSARQLYNYRSGKWSLPSDLYPALCKRFGSRALLHALEADCEETPEEVPESFELTQLDAFADGVITRQELDELIASGDQVIQHVSHFKAIAKTDYERRQRIQSAR
jgi:transcriptional regulator with XRE-family HTH domain